MHPNSIYLNKVLYFQVSSSSCSVYQNSLIKLDVLRHETKPTTNDIIGPYFKLYFEFLKLRYIGFRKKWENRQCILFVRLTTSEKWRIASSCYWSTALIRTLSITAARMRSIRCCPTPPRVSSMLTDTDRLVFRILSWPNIQLLYLSWKYNIIYRNEHLHFN